MRGGVGFMDGANIGFVHLFSALLSLASQHSRAYDCADKRVPSVVLDGARYISTSASCCMSVFEPKLFLILLSCIFLRTEVEHVTKRQRNHVTVLLSLSLRSFCCCRVSFAIVIEQAPFSNTCITLLSCSDWRNTGE